MRGDIGGVGFKGTAAMELGGGMELGAEVEVQEGPPEEPPVTLVRQGGRRGAGVLGRGWGTGKSGPWGPVGMSGSGLGAGRRVFGDPRRCVWCGRGPRGGLGLFVGMGGGS